MYIDDALIDKLTQLVSQTLLKPEIMLEASGRHCHLTREAIDALFGEGYQLTKVSELSQPGQYACKERVRIIGPKGDLCNVIVLGPERPENQIEVSFTDSVVLGLRPPVRLSSQLEDAPAISLAGPRGEVTLSESIVVAKRHIHMSEQDAALYGLQDGQILSVFIPGIRSLTFHDVPLRVSSKFATAMHIDYDEANACGFQKGMKAQLLLNQDK